jgi:hypothetical protein
LKENVVVKVHELALAGHVQQAAATYTKEKTLALRVTDNL